jgi:hypothetical protein
MADVIQLLRELRQSSESSVVTGIEQVPSDQRPQVKHPIESWLVEQILDQLTNPAGRTLSLVVLAGNAGDGKSYLLREIRQRLREEAGSDPTQVRWLLDATEADHQTQRSVDRLDEYFEAFGDSESWDPPQLHVIAMNTGTFVRFEANALTQHRFETLCDVLSLQLAIKGAPDFQDVPQYWDRFDRVLVIDLDRRALIPLAQETESFLDQMLDALDPTDPSGFLAAASTSCETCSFSESCPVNANLVALRHKHGRRRLNTLLLDVALEDRAHLGPRGLWHLLYQMTIGGLDSAAIVQQRPLPSCGDMGEVDDATRAQSLFFAALFDELHEGADAGGSALAAELGRVDPAMRFTLDAHEYALAAGLSPAQDLQLCRMLGEQLGLAPEALRGPTDDSRCRAAGAVRRAFFIHPSDPDLQRHEWLRIWADELRMHGLDVLEADVGRHDSVRIVVRVLTDIFGAERPGLWHLNLPWESLEKVYTQLRLAPGRMAKAADARVLGPDTHRQAGLRPVARELAERLGTYPLSITVPLRDGPSARITWPLFRLLRQVDEQQYVTASLDPERVQNLERIGASLGARAAVAGVAVLTGEGGLLCEGYGDGGFDVVDL